MKIYTIYAATNTVNQKQYIGFDSNWPKRRRAHKVVAFNAKAPGYRTAFRSAIRKYGFESFEWRVLYQSKDRDHTLKEMEPHFIAEYNTYCRSSNSDGYNLTLGGEGSPGPNGRKGKPSKQSRQISTPHGLFDGMRMAATELNLSVETIKYRLKRTSFPDWFYIDGKTPQITMPKGRGRQRQISTPYGIFNSVAQCSRKTGLSISTVFDRLSSSLCLDWFYTGVEAKTTERPIITPHGQFLSISQASKQLTLPLPTIIAKLKSKVNVDWYYAR